MGTKEIILETIRDEIPDHCTEVETVINLILSGNTKDVKTSLQDEYDAIVGDN